MRKAVIWIGLAGVVLFAVVVVLALVRAPIDPARWVKHKLFPSKGMMMYEARLQLTLVRQMENADMDQWLAAENATLDSEEFLAPLVKSLGLAAEWKLPGEQEALAEMRKRCELRKGDLPTQVVLAVRDPRNETASRMIEALGKAYIERHKSQMPPPGDGFGGGFNGGF